MSEQQSFTLFTYSRCGVRGSNRWVSTGIPDVFFEDVEATRQAVLAIRDEVSTDPVDLWSPVNIEKVETRPITKDVLLAMLNQGFGAIVRTHEVIETIDYKSSKAT